MALTLTGHPGSGDPLLDTDLRDLEIVTTGAGTYLLAATGQRTGLARDDDRPVGHPQHADAAAAQAHRVRRRSAAGRLDPHTS